MAREFPNGITIQGRNVLRGLVISGALNDAVANPSNVDSVANYGLVWDATNSVWRRQQGDTSGRTLVAHGDSTATGTLTTSGGVNQAVSLTGLQGLASAMVDISGTWTQTTAANLPVFEVTIDGTNWRQVAAFPISTSQGVGGSPQLSPVSGQTGAWQLDIAGFSGVRVRIPANLTTGPATVYIRGTMGDPPDVDLATAQGRIPAFASLNIGASLSAQAFIPASTLGKAKIYAIVVVADAATTFTLNGLAASPGAVSLAANGGFSAIGQPSAHILESSAVNTAVTVTTGAGAIKGWGAYFYEP